MPEFKTTARRRLPAPPEEASNNMGIVDTPPEAPAKARKAPAPALRPPIAPVSAHPANLVMEADGSIAGISAKEIASYDFDMRKARARGNNQQLLVDCSEQFIAYFDEVRMNLKLAERVDMLRHLIGVLERYVAAQPDKDNIDWPPAMEGVPDVAAKPYGRLHIRVSPTDKERIFKLRQALGFTTNREIYSLGLFALALEHKQPA